MNGFLLDTHIWWWYLTGSKRLSPRLRIKIERAQGSCWLSPVSVWELGMLIKRGRISTPLPFRRWVETAFERFPLNEATLNREVALTSHEISFSHRDLADHLIAATSLVYGIPLMTMDDRLKSAKELTTVR